MRSRRESIVKRQVEKYIIVDIGTCNIGHTLVPLNNMCSNTKFMVAILPLLVLISSIIIVVICYGIEWDHTYSPTGVEILKAVVFTLFMRVLLMILRRFKSMFKISDANMFNSHVEPVLYELIKVGLLGFIALHEFDGQNWKFRLCVGQFGLIAAVFSGWSVVEIVQDFMPMFYFKRYSRFLQLYDDFQYMESREDDSRVDATLQVVESLRREPASVSGETLAEVLPKQISIQNIPHANPSGSITSPKHSNLNDSNSGAHEIQFNDSCLTPKHGSKSIIQDSNSSPTSLGKYKSCYNLVDKLYSISPKNTFHLVTASATAVHRDEVDVFNENLPLNSQPEYFDVSFESDNWSINSQTQSGSSSDSNPNSASPKLNSTGSGNSVGSSDSDSASVHTTDTHFGGGGGGNFKYKLPDGSKLKFGGGAGFDFKHKDRHHCDSQSNSSCSKSTNSRSTLTNSHRPSTTSKWKFHYRLLINWLIPMKKKDASLNQKLSKYNLRSSVSDMSLCTTLMSRPRTNYQAIDLEAQPLQAQEQKHSTPFSKYEFNNYVSLSLGLDKFKVDYDPIYEEFGTKLIRDLSYGEVLVYHLNRVIWEVGSLLMFCVNYLNSDVTAWRLLVNVFVVIILKLFNSNFIDKLNRSLLRVLLVKVTINCVIFCICVL